MLIAWAALGLAACGQRGPLYLPEEAPVEVRQTTPATTPPPPPSEPASPSETPQATETAPATETVPPDQPKESDVEPEKKPR
jgi:predicted small lipoprotein YifL